MNANIIKILKRVNFLKYFNLTSSTIVNNKKISIPVLNEIGFDNLPVLELWMCDLMKFTLSANGGFFMDIGVNVGQTLIKLRSVDSERQYVGFEPNPECVHYIDRLVKINGFKNIDLIPVGLYDRNSILTLKLYSESPADQGASLIENFREGKVFQKINVPVFEYSDIETVRNLGSIAMIKIDVEGAELEVLMGLKKKLIEHHPIVLVEILPAYNKEVVDRVERQNKIGVLLNEIGYEILRIHKNESKSNVERLEKLVAFDIHGNIELSDYALVPANMSEQMLNHFNKN
jgi:FkbM family methyltransferase